MFTNNTKSIFRRHGDAQHMMALATMPRTGVVEYIDLLPKVKLTGRVWRDGSVGTRVRSTRRKAVA